jgi:hypothetical protein
MSCGVYLLRRRRRKRYSADLRVMPRRRADSLWDLTGGWHNSGARSGSVIARPGYGRSPREGSRGLGSRHGRSCPAHPEFEALA